MKIMTSYKYYFKNYTKKYYNIYTRKQKVVNNFKFINYFILVRYISDHKITIGFAPEFN